MDGGTCSDIPMDCDHTALEQVPAPSGEIGCPCGNNASEDGFYCSQADGTWADPVGGRAGWDGQHYTCWCCGRVIDQDTYAVVTTISAAALAAARAEDEQH